MIRTLTLVVYLTLIGNQDPQEYARPELLVEASALAKSDPAQNIVILDARSKAKYDKGHVQGARWIDLESWSKAFAAGQDAKQWARKIGELGIDNKTRVIIYDDTMAKDAARIWWILRY